MSGLQEWLPKLKPTVDSVIRFLKARRREEAALALAALLVWLGYSFIKWLPERLQEFVKSWKGDLIVPGVFYVAGLLVLLYGIYRIWKLTYTPELPPPANRPSAIKGPLAFTPADGELFRKLGREDELRKLFGHVADDQVRLVVLMGASGAGKTSLLRAGLTDILKETGINYHYWEARPSDSSQGLLLAVQQNWRSQSNGEGGDKQAATELKSLDELVNPAPELGRHVIVLDQFEQLGAADNGQIFRLLRKVARSSKPPHRVTWVIAFRREYRANWSDFIIPEQDRKFFPPELSVRLFTAEQARDVISQLIEAAGLSVEQKVVDNLIDAATVDGEVSSVDIGIGLLVLSELHERQGAKTLTEDVYHFAGGAEGLLTQYINRCLENFPDEDRRTLLAAMLALRDEETNQRIAEGKTAAELAAEVEAAANEPVNAARLKTELERLTQRDIRLLEHATADDAETRYRLPHERLIPAINRLAGKLIGEREEAKQKLSGAFSAWRNSPASQYLLKGKALRLVEQYQSQIPWGRDEQEKLAFLKRSQRRRATKRLLSLALVISLLAGGWLGYPLVQRYEARKYLQENNYPPELYDYQRQLKTLGLSTPLNLKYLSFLNSDTLEELGISATKSTNSMEGLADSLSRYPNIKKLTLSLSNSEVIDVSGLPNSLKELTLELSNSKVTDVSGLPDSLTKLSLDLSYSKVTDVSQLPNSLTELTLNISHSEVTDVSRLPHSLTKLSLDLMFSEVTGVSQLPRSLTKLSLNLGSSKVTDVSGLPNSLTDLTLDLGDNQVKFLPPLPHSLTKLSLNLGSSKVTDVSQLPNSLTELSLDLRDSKVTDVSRLPHLLTDLSLYLGGTKVTDVSQLPRSLTKLSLSLGGSEVTDVSGLPNSLTDLMLDLGDNQGKVLQQLPHSLTKLSLDLGVSKVTDMSGLPNSLTDLTLHFGYSEVTDVSRLPNSLTKLSLDLMLSGVTDVSGLPNSLTELTIYLVRSQVTDVSRLPHSLTKLSLYLGGSQVTDVSGLPNSLTDLTLDLRGSQGKVLQQLPHSLTKLSLNLRDSKVSDVSAIQQLNCQTLDLSLTTEQRMSLKTIPKSVTYLAL
ncbi:MAG: hypothetical protein QOF02_1299 [Blastocatellia bacterium]|jgi:hypothetical protein|nr:hypothetical protein [Blastocatellia bacterium]